jgi:hypothetical protein
MKLGLDKIFYKVVCHHIIYMCVFLNLDNFFVMVCTSFHRDVDLHPICCLYNLHPI